MKMGFGLIIVELEAKNCVADGPRAGGFFGTQVVVPKFRSLVQRPLSAFQTTFLRALVESGIQGVQGQGVWTLMIVESVDQ